MGSLEKLDIQRIILRNPNIVINGARELMDALKLKRGSVAESAMLASGLSNNALMMKYCFNSLFLTGWFKFFPSIPRTPNDLRVGLPLKGIRQFHQITFRNGEIKVLDLSCHDCLKLGQSGEE